MTVEAERSPTLESVIRAALRWQSMNLRVSLPGRVEKYYPTDQTADIQPLLGDSYYSEEGESIEEALPVLPNVPVQFPRSKQFFITFPLAPGDHVTLIFQDRSIEEFVESKGVSLPGTQPPSTSDVRMHNLSDAVAVPGFFPRTGAIVDIDPLNMVMGQDNAGAQIAIKPGGEVQVTYASGNTVKVEDAGSAAKMTIGDGARSALIAENFKTTYDGLQVPTGTGLSGNPIVPIPASDISTKVKFPDG
jgi:hypothetical protein